MKKRILSALLAGLMAFSMLTACGSSGAKSSSDAPSKTADGSGKTKLSLWTVFTGSDGDILKKIIKDYNETNKDNIEVEVDIMPNDTLQSKLPTAVSTSTGPSFVLMGIEYLKQYAENDCLEEINDFWDKSGLKKDNFLSNVISKSYVGDKQYGVPMQYNLQYLYYNKDLFKAAGISNPPKTLEELRDDAQKLTDKAKGVYGLALPKDYGYYVQYLWGNGGDVVDVDKNKNMINSNENIKTLEWIQNMMKEGVSPQCTAAEADTMFQSGQVAMCMSGPWNINALNGLGMNYGIAAIPSGSSGAFSAEGGCAYMLPKGADQKTRVAVYKFMAYWLNDSTLKEWSMKNGFPVWSNSLMNDSEIKSNEILTEVSKASTIGRDWHLGYKYGSQIDKDVMNPLMEKVLAGEDVRNALKDASNSLDGILKQ